MFLPWCKTCCWERTASHAIGSFLDSLSQHLNHTIKGVCAYSICTDVQSLIGIVGSPACSRPERLGSVCRISIGLSGVAWFLAKGEGRKVGVCISMVLAVS